MGREELNRYLSKEDIHGKKGSSSWWQGCFIGPMGDNIELFKIFKREQSYDSAILLLDLFL